MSNQNDTKILELKKQIQLKKEELTKQNSRFNAVTNCSIELNENRININTLQRDGLMDTLIKLNIIRLSVTDLGLENEYKISGYLVSEWMQDIKSRLEILSRKDEERKLKIMEDKLVKLLSEEKKTELEIEEIAELLK